MNQDNPTDSSGNESELEGLTTVNLGDINIQKDNNYLDLIKNVAEEYGQNVDIFNAKIVDPKSDRKADLVFGTLDVYDRVISDLTQDLNARDMAKPRNSDHNDSDLIRAKDLNFVVVTDENGFAILSSKNDDIVNLYERSLGASQLAMNAIAIYNETFRGE